MSTKWADWKSRRPANACQVEIAGGQLCGAQPHTGLIRAKYAPDSNAFLVCAEHRAELEAHGYVTVIPGQTAKRTAL